MTDDTLIILYHVGALLFILNIIPNLYLSIRKAIDPQPVTSLDVHFYVEKIVDLLKKQDYNTKKNKGDVIDVIIRERLKIQDKINELDDNKNTDLMKEIKLIYELLIQAEDEKKDN